MWKMGYTGVRVTLVAVGLVVLLVGWVSTISAEYVSGTDFTMESHGGTAIVYAVDEQAQHIEGHPMQVPVFEGSGEEALAYTEQESGDSDFSGPHTLMIVGVLLVIVTLIPLRETLRYSPKSSEIKGGPQ